jgi:hypothetical protein
MRNALLFLAGGLVAGFALSAWLAPDGPSPERAADVGTAELSRRIAALEQSLRSESARRATLATEVAELRARLERDGRNRASGAPAPAPAGSAPAAAAETAAETAAEGDAAAGAGAPGSRRPPRASRGNRGGLIERLVAAGFSTDRAADLDRRASELRMQALEAQYEAARSGQPAGGLPSMEQTLREELGDADYERYLNALGRPTQVAVRNVLASSPAEQAGLQPGDEITRYAGPRVFDIGDLNRLTYEGQPGETVAVDIVRAGQPMQIYVPRGPVGILGGRFPRRP